MTKFSGVHARWPILALLAVFGSSTIALLELAWVYHLKEDWVSIGSRELYLLLGVFIEEVPQGIPDEGNGSGCINHEDGTCSPTSYLGHIGDDTLDQLEGHA